MGIPRDGIIINCYGMEWDGTEKYVPWTSLVISNKSVQLPAYMRALMICFRC